MTSPDSMTRPTIRAAAILIEDGRILLVKQDLAITRHWEIPGGHLEYGEKLGDCLVRELKEETGLDVRAGDLLYVTDMIAGDKGAHVVDIAFLVERVVHGPGVLAWRHMDPHPSRSSAALREVRMVPLDELPALGFPPGFLQLAKAGFSGRGSYQGDFGRLYGGE